MGAACTFVLFCALLAPPLVLGAQRALRPDLTVVRKLDLAHRQLDALTVEKGVLVRGYEARLSAAMTRQNEALAEAEELSNRSRSQTEAIEHLRKQLKGAQAELRAETASASSARASLSAKLEATKSRLEEARSDAVTRVAVARDDLWQLATHHCHNNCTLLDKSLLETVCMIA